MTATSNCAGSGTRHPLEILRGRLSQHSRLAISCRRPTPELVDHVGQGALNLIEDLEVLSNALVMAMKALPNSTDEDDAKTLLLMAEAYSTGTWDRAFDFCAEVVAALDRGNLVAAPAANLEAGND